MSKRDDGWYWVRRKSWLDEAGFLKSGWIPAKWHFDLLWLPEVGGPDTAWPKQSPAGPFEWGTKEIDAFEFGPRIPGPPEPDPPGSYGKCWKIFLSKKEVGRPLFCTKSIGHDGECGHEHE
jgi:hypothetical protein